jgi:hypothetical protein
VKKIGIIYTTDNWKTNQVAYASYEGSLGDGYEQWGVDLFPLPLSFFYEDLKYCIFGEMNGVKYYDNNSTLNYTIKGQL